MLNTLNNSEANVAESHEPISDGVEKKDSFVRIEDKFIVERRHSAELLNLLQQKLRPAYFHNETRWTLVESLYFDSRDLHFFRDHFTKLKARYKLRIRRYAPNGEWNLGAAFIESKCKAEGICIKERLALDHNSYERILKGRILRKTAALKKANGELAAPLFSERVNLMNQLIRDHGAIPQLRVAYRRHAFEGEGVRVTIDEDINFQTKFETSKETVEEVQNTALWDTLKEYTGRFSAQDKMIVEVKHSNNVPAWIPEYMSQIGTSQTNFSKYCWSVSQVLGKLA